ncbi:MAG: hypothetical protein CSA81_07835 [Acidobacteria bacterium]|nr:MAG: hypothetical protein CSA81_07835 [Acidobacteriota bacterium]
MEFVKLETEDRIALVTINRPKALNALNNQVFIELEQIIDNLEADRQILCTILTGSGEKAFVAGADIKELATLSAFEATEVAKRGQSVFRKIENSRMPYIAAVNGFALGGGCELALACSFRIASANAQFGLPEVTLGLIPGYGGTQRLGRIVGKGRALEMTCTGGFIPARRACEMGLVNEVVEQQELLDVCRKKAHKIIKNAPIAIQYALKAVNNGLEMSQDDGELFESSLFGVLAGTEDAKEGLNAFIEKRKATFKGQ